MLQKRIEWVDIFKALAIFLVVVGHATGIFNSYIYMFHMAAFFFIAGYGTTFVHKKFNEILGDKILALAFPFVFLNVFFHFLRYLLSLTSLEKIFYAGQPIIENGLISFFKYGRTIDVMGATWFLLVLFLGCLIAKIILNINHKKTNILFLVTTVSLFLLGYVLVYFKLFTVWMLELALIAQLYICLGIYCRENPNVVKSAEKYKFMGFLISLVFLYLFKTIGGNSVNYPTRYFGNPFTNLASSLSGILVLFYISFFISSYIKNKVKVWILLVGGSSFSILVFHFIGFRIFSYILYILGIENVKACSQIVPESYKPYWFPLVVFAIVFSIAMKLLISYSSMLDFLIFGRNNCVRQKFNTYLSKIYDKTRVLYNYILANINEAFPTIRAFVQKNPVLCISLLYVSSICLCLIYRQFLYVDDELQAFAYARMGLSNFYEGLLKPFLIIQSRPNIVGSFFQYIIFSIKYIWIIKLANMSVIFINAVVLSFLIKRLTNNIIVALFSFLSFFIFLTHSWEPGIPNAYILYFGVPISCFFISLINFDVYLTSCKKKNLIVSALFFLISIFSYELFVIYIPLFLIIAIKKKNRNLSVLCALKPFVYIIFFYLIVLIWMKISLGRGQYGGARISIQEFSMFSFLYTIQKLSIASLPCALLFTPTYKFLFSFYNNVYYNTSHSVSHYMLQLLTNYISLKTILFSCAVAASSYVLLSKAMLKWSKKTYSKFSLLCCFYFFAPTGLLALTPLYQKNVASGMFLYVTASYFAYLSFITFFSITFPYITSNLELKYKRKAIIAVSFVITIVSNVILCNNTLISDYKERVECKFQLLNDFCKSGVLDSLSSQDIVVAPSLWKQVGSDGVIDNYWNIYFKMQTGKDIQVKKKKEITLGNIYYLKYEQARRENEQYIVFGREENLFQNTYREPIVNVAKIFYLGKNSKYYVIADRLENSGLEKETILATVNDFKMFGKSKYVYLTDSNIIINSVSILGEQLGDLSLANKGNFAVMEIPKIFSAEVIVYNQSYALSIKGENFSSGCVVALGKNKLPTAYGNTGWLTATISEQQMLNHVAGNIEITVINNTLISNKFNISLENFNQVPVVTSILPSSIIEEEPFNLQPNALNTLSIQGDNFQPSSKVLLNGTIALPTTYGNRNWITSHLDKKYIKDNESYIKIQVINGFKRSNYIKVPIVPEKRK